MDNDIVPVALEKAYRLLNLGATSIVSAEFGGESDAMPAAWTCPLSMEPFRATAVVDGTHFTRRLIDESGMFALQLPTAGIARATLALGSVSKNDDPAKLEKSGAHFFFADGFRLPLVEGCAGWMIFKVVPGEERNAEAHDLIIGECIAAWADARVFANGHWQFEKAPPSLRTLHYVAGQHFYAIGEAVNLD